MLSRRAPVETASAPFLTPGEAVGATSGRKITDHAMEDMEEYGEEGEGGENEKDLALAVSCVGIVE